jgi:hypothetical protein
MVLAPVKCPHSGSDKVRKNGTSKNGKQRFLCCNERRTHRTFVEYHTCHAYESNIRSRIFFSIVNRSGAQAPGIAEDIVPEALLWYVNYDHLNNRRRGILELSW